MKYTWITILFLCSGVCIGQKTCSGVCSEDVIVKHGCHKIDEYLVDLPEGIALYFPCLNELIDSNSIYVHSKFQKLKELSATESETTVSKWIAERLEFRISYTNEISKLEKDDSTDKLFVVEDDDGYDVEAGLVFTYPFDSYYKFKKTRNLSRLQLDQLDIQKDELKRESNIVILDIYQEFETLVFSHAHCVCSLDFTTNCTSIFYKLREKALKLLYLSSYTNESIIDLWEEVNPAACGAPDLN